MRILTKCLFIFLLLHACFAFAQDNEGVLNFSKKELNVGKKESRDPVQLVNALTKGRPDDLDKFNAIYAWVATHIRYSYRTYYSSSGTYSLPASYILRTRHAVCLGYANLMDTLLTLAGIGSTTIHGYAKDELFDVGDSIYMDNHAWNAVKLNGLWYLYDVTWSGGKTRYEYTRFSKFIAHLLDKYKKKYKQVQVGRRIKVGFKSECRDNSGPAYYFKQKLWNKKLRRFLMLFPWIIHICNNLLLNIVVNSLQQCFFDRRQAI